MSLWRLATFGAGPSQDVPIPAFQKERADCFPHRLEVERIDIPLEDVLRTGHIVTPP